MTGLPYGRQTIDDDDIVSRADLKMVARIVPYMRPEGVLYTGALIAARTRRPACAPGRY